MSTAASAFHINFNTTTTDNDNEPSTSSSSSIGNNSDDEDTDPSDEIQSAPFDSLQALEHVLPIRRGISNFYSGKSKSFACLSASLSAKHIAKPDNVYNRKRRNLIASAAHVWDRLHRTSSPVIHKSSFMRASRSTVAFGVAMSRSSSSSSGSSSGEDLKTGSFSHLPPLHPN